MLFLAKCPEAKKLLARLERKHGKAKALSILAHRIGRAVYFMLTREGMPPRTADRPSPWDSIGPGG